MKIEFGICFIGLSLLASSCNKSAEKLDKTGKRSVEYEIAERSRGLHGYIAYETTDPPEGYGAGISFYSAIWPLIDQPLANFQIGLPSAWLIPDNRDVDFPLCPTGTYARDNWPKRGPTWGSVFQTVEGGLGYWAGNRFRYGPPKFSMNATSSCYDFEIASPGWAFFHSASPLPDEKMGIAQLSNRILVPPDGLTFEGKPNGQFLGYAWMALPLMNGNEGPPPTGDQSWTLFLNAINYKGPVAYYIAETWSKIWKEYPVGYGCGLDTRPGLMGGGAMEINTVPRFDANRSEEPAYYKIPRLQFPVDEEGRTILVQDVKYYSREALFNPFKTWRDGKNANTCDGSFDPRGAWEPELSTHMPVFDQDGVILENMDQIFETRIFSDKVFGIQWKQSELTPDGCFPQYFKELSESTRVPVSRDEVPEKLSSSEFRLAERGDPYTSPGTGSWGLPGPASGPYEVSLADGSTVIYCWYRFIDQPSLQQFDWSSEEREKLQSLVERIHVNWTPDRNYMEPPGTGELVALDPALLVTPPEEYSIGYVPIVTGQK